MNKSSIPKVAILMSTYNGSKYISEQIISILNQQSVNICIFIRDDVSTDGTATIIQDVFGDDSRIKLICGKENLFSGVSFMKLLYAVSKKHLEEFDYFGFADQDDIWLPEKISVAVKAIERIGNNKEVLYCSNQYIYYKNVNEGLRFAEDERPDFLHILNSNKYSGCTFLMNRKAVTYITNCMFPPDDVLNNRFHDTWCLLAILLSDGNVIYDHEAYILYRIHSYNVVGIKKTTFFGRIERIVKGEGNHKSSRRRLRQKTAIALKDRYETNDKRKREVINEFSTYSDSLRNKFQLLLDNEVMKSIDEHYIIAFIRVLLNLV